MYYYQTYSIRKYIDLDIYHSPLQLWLTLKLLTNIFRTRGNKILESKCSRWSTIALCCRSFGYNESFCPYFPTKYAAIA